MPETKKPAKPRAKPQKPEVAAKEVAPAKEVAIEEAVVEEVAVAETPRKSTRTWF